MCVCGGGGGGGGRHAALGNFRKIPFISHGL